MVNGFFPKSLDEALRLRAQTDAVPYAGGTDLMVGARPDARYLFIGKLPELRDIRDDGEHIRVGAAVTFTQALESPLVPPLMKEALSRIAAPAIRNAGTFGGNLANGSPKADTVAVEFAADAVLRLVSVRGGERLVPVEAFYRGRRDVDLKPDELITEILLPRAGLENYYYEKVGGRQALAISRVSFAGVYREEGGVIASLSAAFGAVADTVLRFRDLEAMLVGKTPGEARALRGAFLDAYAGRLALTEGRVSAAYRKDVCLNLLGAFLDKFGL